MLKVENILKKQHYALFGHSATKICRWTKKSLVDEDFCYKEKFYGIKSHLCCQMTPWLSCQNECIHCWRPIELNFKKLKVIKIEDPKKIISSCIVSQKRLLTGFGGNSRINKKKFKEAQEPRHFAISLIGEPTLYPKLSELIKELRKQGKTSFLVTNGLLPEKLKELHEKNALPTQLYISLNYPNEKIFRKFTKNEGKDSWKKLNKSLSLLSQLPTRRVIRITLVKRLNAEDKMLKDYAKLIKKASPDFVEVKSYMAVGFSRKRLGYERMLSHEEVKEYAKKLLEVLDKYKFLDEKKESRVVLIGKDKSKRRIKEEKF